MEETPSHEEVRYDYEGAKKNDFLGAGTVELPVRFIITNTAYSVGSLPSHLSTSSVVGVPALSLMMERREGESLGDIRGKALVLCRLILWSS